MHILAVYPGTFDPVHYGHMDIIRRAALLFGNLRVAVYDKPAKNLLFSAEERLDFMRQAVHTLGLTNVSVVGYHGLTVDLCRAQKAQVIVRGLRVFSDFEFEFRMALANRRLAPDIDVVTLITNEEHTFLSSSTVKEIALLNGDVSTMVPPFIKSALREKYTAQGG